MHPSLAHQEHRPWEMPQKPWAWSQNWRNLLFAHWPVETELLQKFTPKPLKVQKFNGRSWISVISFCMEDVTRRYVPPIRGISEFPELNVRIYVEHDNKPGVLFFSLDAANAAAIFVGKHIFHMPYMKAAVELNQTDDGMYHFHSTRANSTARFQASYKPTSPTYYADAGSFEQWITERYCLYAHDQKGHVYRTEVHHPQWQLQDVEANIELHDLATAYGIDFAEPPTHMQYSHHIEVIAWNPERIA